MTKKTRQKWPPIYPVTNRSGAVSYVVDLGKVNDNRERRTFASKAEAETFAAQKRIERANEGTLTVALPADVKLDAAKANQILEPHNITILETAKYYYRHVLSYKDAPPIKEIVAKYIYDSEHIRKLKPRALEDVRNRLKMFSGDYGEDKLYNLTITEIQEWVFDDDWMPRTQISYRTKLYQLWEYALDKTWVDSNIIAKIPVPKVDDTAIKVLTVNQAKAMLVNANDFGLLPYVAIGLFCGIRSSEMLSMNGNHVDFANGVVHVPANVAKGRQKRTVIIQPALTIWLEPCKKDLAKGQPLVENFRKSFDDLREAAKITDWPTNGLRHSFASYYLAKFRNVPDTAYQMGNSPEVIKRHYDAVVLPAEAEKFWNLRP